MQEAWSANATCLLWRDVDAAARERPARVNVCRRRTAPARFAHATCAYFEVEVLPLEGLLEPGVPGTAPEVAPCPVGDVPLPDASVALPEDEPEDMPEPEPDELLLGLLVEELPEVP